jgi:hypothetical protein
LYAGAVAFLLHCAAMVSASVTSAARSAIFNGRNTIMEITVDSRELRDFAARLNKIGKETPANIKRGLTVIGSIVKGKAVAFAPRSMTKSEYVKTLVHGKTKRRVFTSGQLKGSIKAEVFPDRVEIGVASNSRAGAYAEKVHETWKKPSNPLYEHNTPETRKEFIFEAAKKSDKEIEKAVDKILADIVLKM